MTDTSGPTSPTPFVFYDPDGSCWRTSQGTFPWASGTYSGTWPKRGSMRSGACFEHPTWEPPTDAPASSSLLGTPNAHERTHSPRQVHHGAQLANQVADLLQTPTRADGQRTFPSVNARENYSATTLGMQVIELLPTPRTSDTNGPGAHGDGGPDLRTVVTLLPTPTVSEATSGPHKNKMPGASHGLELRTAVWRLHGDATSPPSDGGNTPSDDPHPHQLTIEDD